VATLYPEVDEVDGVDIMMPPVHTPFERLRGRLRG
jgi:hypothetical protein